MALTAAALVVVVSSPGTPAATGGSLASGRTSSGGATSSGGKSGGISISGTPAKVKGSNLKGAALTSAIPGTRPTVLQSSTNLGPASGGARTEVTLALPLRARATLNLLYKSEYTRSSKGYHHFLTPAEFDSQFAPTAASVRAVTTWVTKVGLDVVSVSSNRTLVQVSGTRSQLSTAFGTSFEAYRAHDGVKYVTPTSGALLPAALTTHVASVVGLSSLGRLGVSAPVVSSGSPATSTSSGVRTLAASSYNPQQVASIYNAPASAVGAGQTIANIDEGALGQVVKDLSTFENAFGLPHVPVTVVPVGTPSSDTASQTEWDLDAQYSTGLAPKASRLLLYDSHSLSDSDILNAINLWVTQDKAKEAGLSGGECDSVAQADGALSATDDALAQAVAQGQTLFVATGDQGSLCEPLRNGPSVSYPASSQYAVAVGGTTVLSTNPLSEAAWPHSGGGVSGVESEAPYQLPVVGRKAGRTVPDVSLDSDPATGFDCIVDGKPEVIGGTSAATQAWVGIWARAQGAHGGDLGFANVAIYAASPADFHDVTKGSNGSYSATRGYDLVTGRGTPNINPFLVGA